MQSVPSDRSPSRGRSGPHLPPSPTLHHQSVLAHVAGEVSLQRTALALNLLHHRQVCLSHLSPPLLSNRIDRTRGNEWPPIATRSSRGKHTRWNSRQYLKQKAHASLLPIRSDRSEGSLRSSQRWKAEKQPGTDIDALESRTVGDAEAGAAAGVRVVEEAVWGDGEGEEMGEAAEREGVGEAEALFSNGDGAQTDQEREVECGKTGVVAAAVTDGEFFSVGGEEETERRGNK